MLLLLFSIFLFGATATAQISTNRYEVTLSPENLGTCGGSNNSNEEVTIIAQNGSVHGFSITFNLPTGVEYVSGTATINTQTGLADYVLTESGTAAEPIFSLERPNDGNWGIADKVVFSFERSANCDAIASLYNGGIFKDAHTINFTDAYGAQTATDNDPNVSSYNLMAASLNISEIDLINGAVGNTYTRDITVAQGGSGCTSSFTHIVTVGDDVAATYSLSFGGVALTPSINGNEYTYFIDLNSAPFNTSTLGSCFDNGEYVVLTESFRIDDCEETSILHNAYWGCSVGEVCQQAAQQTGSINFGLTKPEIELTDTDSNQIDLCNSIVKTVKIENKNTTIGAVALDVGINIGLGANSGIETTANYNSLWSFDGRFDTRSVSNFRFGTNTVTPQSWATDKYPGYAGSGTHSFPPNYFATDPDGPGGFEDLDNDGFYDDLAPGASTELSFDFLLSPRENCGTGRFDYLGWEHTRFDVYFKDQCKAEQPSVKFDMNYINILRDYNRITEIDAPTDVADADIFQVGIKPSFFSRVNGMPLCNGNPMLSDDPSSVWTVTITVPAGIDLIQNPPSNFSQNGNEITYTTTEIPETNGYFEEWVYFPLKLTCGPNGLQTIPFKTNYKCGTCWDQDIHCGSVQIYTHCPGGCVGPIITEFDANRTTAGWTDDTMSTKVVLDENTHETKKYLAGDQMNLVTKAKISNTSLDNLFADVTYQTVDANAGGSDVITFIDGTITITNYETATAQTVPISVAPTLTTNGTTDHVLTFDLSSYRSIFGNSFNYHGISGTNTDEIVLDLNFEFKKGITLNTYFELTNFRGEFYAYSDYPTNTQKLGCDTWGDRAFYGEQYSAASGESSQITGCEPSNTQINFNQYFTPGDIFPNEYRPPTIWKSSTIEVPQGATFTGNVTTISFVNNPSTANGMLIATEANGVVTITPGPNFVNRDLAGVHYPRFFIDFIGTCNTSDKTRISYTTNYENYAYLDNPEPAEFTKRLNFLYTQPNFLLQSSQPTVNGSKDVVEIDFQLGNNNDDSMPYNWFEVTIPEGVTIQDVYQVNGTTETLINYHEGTGKVYIEGGSIDTNTTSSYRMKVKYSNCDDQVFTIKHAWDCLGYPGYPNTSLSDYQSITSGCYTNTTTVTIEPKDSQAQLTITNQPSSTTALCTPLNYEMEVLSAQLADLIEPYIEFEIPGGASAITINSVDVTYPLGSTNTEAVSVTITDGVAKLNIFEHSQIVINNGIVGDPATNSLQMRTAKVALNLSLECDFISNSNLGFKIYGKNPCGANTLGNGARVVSNSIGVTGATKPYSAISTINLPDGGAALEGCGIEKTLNIVTTIKNGTTGSQDYGQLILPAGIEYIPNSLVANNSNVASITSVATVGNHQEILLQYPAGVIDNGTIDFDFDIITTNDAICNDESEVKLINYVEVTGMNCGATTCSSLSVGTGDTYEVLPLAKPNFTITDKKGTFTTNTNGSNDFVIDLSILNNGIVDASAGYTYSIYCADSNDEISGLALTTGALSASIPSSNTLQEIITFSSTKALCSSKKIIVEILPSNNNCMCEALTVLIPLNETPKAINNSSTGNPTNTPVTLDVISNDTDSDGYIDPTTVSLDATSIPNGVCDSTDADGDCTQVTVPGEGVWTVDPTTGQVTFTPETGFTADPTPIEYTVKDNDGNVSNEATITVEFTPQPPVANNDSSTNNTTNTPVTIDVVGNDNDPDGNIDPTTVSLDATSIPNGVCDSTDADGDCTQVTVPGEGVWTVNPTTGQVTFTPETGFTANPTPIEYTVKDNDGNVSNEATITVEFTPQPPVANNDSSTNNTTNTPVTIDVVGNDNDPDGNIDPTTVSLDATSIPNGVCDSTDADGDCTQVTVPGEGVWTVNPTTGQVTFTPETGFTADPTPIEYTVKDNDGNVSNEATITVEFTPQPPVANNDSSTNNTTNTPVTIDVVGNDNDPDGNIDPTTVSLDATSIPNGVCNSTDADGDCTQVTVPGEGVWTVNPTTGQVTFTPETGFTADPTPIEYTVKDNDGNVSNEATITVEFTPQPPVANNDSSTNNTTNTPVTIDVVGNDNDPDGNIDPTTVSLDATSIPNGVCDSTDADGDCTQVTVPGEGVWTVNPTTGQVTFTPETGFTANPTPIEYTVKDNDGNVSNEATITVEFTPQPPVANNDSSTNNTTNTPVTIDVVGNDNDPDGNIDPTTVSLDATSIPNGVCNSTDADGDCTQVTVPGEGVWTVNPTTGQVTFTPETGFTADPTPIEYTVKDNDGNVSNEATITVEFTPQPPVANNDSSTNNTTNTPVTIDVVGNDNDPDGNIDPTTVSLDATSIPNGVCDSTDADGDCTQVTVPGEGVWTVNPTTGQVTFTPETGFTANPTPIEYTVKDNDGNVSNEATITVEFTPQPPVANNDSSTDHTTGEPVTINIMDNDNDPDGNIDPTTVSLDTTSIPNGVCDSTDADGDCTQVTVPGEGVWTVNPTTGQVTFTPETGFTANPTPIEYTVKDNDGNESNIATVTIDYDQCNGLGTADCDGDGIPNYQEIIDGTDPNNPCDSVGGTPPVDVICDTDGDGVLDDQEIIDGTDPNNPCDFDLASITETQTGAYLEADCDGDGVTNEQEIIDGTNPEDPCDFDPANITLEQSGDYLIYDCDGDGIPNGTELTDNTDPSNPCNFIGTSMTLDRTGDWLTSDCDNDTIPNGEEIVDETNPYEPCSAVNGTPPEGTICDIIIESDLVSPGINEGKFQINHIESFPDNTVHIYNRWGVLVFTTNGYDNAEKAFNGISNGRATIQKNEELPVGIYYYVINYVTDGDARAKSGYLYLNR